MKWAIYLVLAVLVAGGWMYHLKPDSAIAPLQEKIAHAEASGESEELEKIDKWRADIKGKEDEKTFTGILLAFLSAGLVGVVVVMEVLPAVAHRFTHAVYDSAEEVEVDVMHDARSKVAQGDYHGAIEAFRTAAAADPMNRLPWVEIAKIQRENLDDPMGAIQTFRTALESQEWELNDAAYLLFRLAELYDEDAKDRMTAASILNQVMEQFPNTRHSANARHRLHEWGLI
ncbi:tetratricopeptide repeat protein [Luteolibacter ambystomatis]|uniref:Tetratricopeptide repeat protein n=1 Tax=Luteolibacter ambystomatis TaxID=2824561 RepID=A0A975G8G6_9BACT|nr:tetratricopeptide repeat protein [Luteolibacter ambystomatis]QUE50898.1 tetratricopeptide repeat protein [Luteolibacter ambystomatis]